MSTDLDQYADLLVPGITEASAYTTLLGRLTVRALDGGDATGARPGPAAEQATVPNPAPWLKWWTTSRPRC